MFEEAAVLGKHVVVRVIMLCFKRQLWEVQREIVLGRVS